MKKKSANKSISSELFAAFLDGNVTVQELQTILDALSDDPRLREELLLALDVDEELETNTSDPELLPMTALAAACTASNYCVLECEKFILRRHGMNFGAQRLRGQSVDKGRQREKGMALHAIGQDLEEMGLIVRRLYQCRMADIERALTAHEDVIAVVDGGELTGDAAAEKREDLLTGEDPDHAVVVLGCDKGAQSIMLYDPASGRGKITCPLEQFEDAWHDSKNYLVTVTTQEEMNTYIPKPIDLSDVELADDLNDLREAIAENAHEIWAESRRKEGWSYGPRRDDVLKQTPDMVPYSQLPESEKSYDREMAMKTIKLLRKLGYDLIKREETELYRVLKQRLEHSGEEFHCRRCGNVIYKHQVFCDKCGLELKIIWD